MMCVPDDDPATVEVWHWKDENVVSEQKLTATRDRDRNTLAAWNIASGRVTPLTINVKEQARLAKHGARSLALDGTPYQNEGCSDASSPMSTRSIRRRVRGFWWRSIWFLRWT